MRLLIVTRGFPPRVGGVETLCRQLAEGFAHRGWGVTVVTFDRYPRQTVQRGPYTVLRLPGRGSDVFEWSGRLTFLLHRLAADVLHVHNLHASVATAAWAARCRYVLTTHYHGVGGTPAARLAHPVYRPLARRIVTGATAVTAVSDSEARLVQRDFGVTPVVIPNGIDPGCPGRHRPRPQRTIAVVSRLVPHKRVDAVVRALPELPGYRLHILGDGPERPGLLAEADRLGVGDRLAITTERLDDDAVRARLRDATVHVNLSAAEAFSYTVLESLAAGTPVVTSGDTALAEWARRFPGAVVTADPARPAHVAAAVRHLAGQRVDVDLGEYALPTILDAYQRVYERAAT